MRNLLNFIINYSTWFVFTFYVLISLLLLFSNQSYQQSVYLTSANSLTGGVYEVGNSISGYFHLRSINEDLQASNAKLENQVFNLQAELARCRSLLADTLRTPAQERYSYILATVINNSTRHPKNYFTINKGLADGIQPGMGVVDHNGIVGIVNVAGPHTARIISLINETQHFSVRIAGTPFVGSLSWRGMDPRVGYVSDVPSHAKYHIGDTVVTSGFSTSFPEGLPVGIIQGKVKTNDDNYFTLKVRLTSDFNSLSTVRVIDDIYRQELDSLASYDLKTE